MSLTATILPPLNETVLTETGVSEANVLVKSLSIKKQTDGTTTIFVQNKGIETLFTLTQKECDHLVKLLNLQSHNAKLTGLRIELDKVRE